MRACRLAGGMRDGTDCVPVAFCPMRLRFAMGNSAGDGFPHLFFAGVLS